MDWMTIIGRLLGHDNVSKIASARLSFGSGWAQSSPAFVVLGGAALIAFSNWFYWYRQTIAGVDRFLSFSPA